MPTRTVPVKSAAKSKINWGAGIGIAATILAYFGIEMSPETQAAVLAGITGVVSVYTWIMRTWFTKSVTKGSL